VCRLYKVHGNVKLVGTKLALCIFMESAQSQAGPLRLKLACASSRSRYPFTCQGALLSMLTGLWCVQAKFC
jgi:hypothetical protein